MQPGTSAAGSGRTEKAARSSRRAGLWRTINVVQLYDTVVAPMKVCVHACQQQQRAAPRAGWCSAVQLPCCPCALPPQVLYTSGRTPRSMRQHAVGRLCTGGGARAGRVRARVVAAAARRTTCRPLLDRADAALPVRPATGAVHIRVHAMQRAVRPALQRRPRQD